MLHRGCLGVTFDQHFDFKTRRDHKKKTYERSDYGSVDDL